MKRRSFQRVSAGLRYRKLFLIAVEGEKTEPQYFTLFNHQSSVVRVSCLRGGHDSAPLQVLKRMEDYIKKEGIGASDEAWLVVDKDQWLESHLSELDTWAKSDHRYGLALSNPKFEYWLLLHFEEGDGVSSSRECSERLKRHIKDYDKGVDIRKITLTQIEIAVRRARLRDHPPCVDWPRVIGQTTVYRLIERILESYAQK